MTYGLHMPPAKPVEFWHVFANFVNVAIEAQRSISEIWARSGLAAVRRANIQPGRVSLIWNATPDDRCQPKADTVRTSARHGLPLLKGREAVIHCNLLQRQLCGQS